MRDIVAVYEMAYALLINQTAAYYAILVAAIVAPVYACFLKRILRSVWATLSTSFPRHPTASLRRRKGPGGGRRAPDDDAGLAEDGTSAGERRAQKKKRGNVKDASDGEADPVTPPKSSSRRSSAVRESGLYGTPNSAVSPRGSSGRRVSGGLPTSPFAAEDPFLEAEEEPFVEPSSPSTRVQSDLAVYGQSIKLAVAPSTRWHAKQPRRPARGFLSGGNDDVNAAIANGEVFYQHTNRVLAIEHSIRRMFMRHQRNCLYRDSNITEQSLNDLFRKPAFQRWYDDNRQELLQEVQVRHNCLFLRSLSSFVLVLLGLCALPAFSFSNKTWASHPLLVVMPGSKGTAAGGGGFRGLPPGAPISQSTVLQLLVSRADAIRSGRGVPAAVASSTVVSSFVPAAVVEWFFALVNHAEVIAMTAAVCALVTSTFMPRGRRRTAVVAVWALAIVTGESIMAGGSGRNDAVRVRPGMGMIVVFSVVAVSVAKAFH